MRNIRKQKNLPQREALTLEVIADANYPADYAPVLTKMANLSAIERVAEKDAAAAAFIVKTTQYFVPLGDRIDREAEIAKLGEELTYYEGFLQSVERKLSNERFVQSAPAAVVDKERAKKADAEAKIAAIREQLAAIIEEQLAVYKTRQVPLDLGLVVREYLSQYPRARHFDVARIVIDQAVRLGVAQADFTGLPAKWQPINDYGAKVQAHVIDKY